MLLSRTVLILDNEDSSRTKWPRALFRAPEELALVCLVAKSILITVCHVEIKMNLHKCICLSRYPVSVDVLAELQQCRGRG